MTFKTSVVAVLLALLMLMHAGVMAVPGHIFIQGQLLDENGTPIVYYDENDQRLPSVLLASRVNFHADETTDTVLLALQQETIIDITSGSSFSIPVELPDEFLSGDELWYELAIDTNQDGLDEADFFEDRFEFASVPFALSAQPVFYFDTHGGHFSSTSSTAGNFFLVSPQSTMNDRVAMAPFTTPPGGVTFDRVNLFIHRLEPGVNFSVGIYDANGEPVYRSPVMNTTVLVQDAYVGLDTAGTSLLPSTVYFTAIAATGEMMIRNIIVPSMPLTGTYFMTPSNGALPDSVNILAIDASKAVVPISLNLTNTAQMPGGARNRRPALDFISTDPNWKGGNPMRIDGRSTH